MIRIVIVDQSNTAKVTWLKALQNEPGLQVVGLVHDGQAAINYVQRIKPDIVLMRINLPILDGLTTTRIISERCLDTQVILVTNKDSSHELNQVLRVGARGYLHNDTNIYEIVEAIRLVHQGYFQLASSLTRKYLSPSLEKEYVFSNINLLKKHISHQYDSITNLRNQSRKRQHKINHKIDSDRFFGELQSNRFEAKRIKLNLKKIESRISFLYKLLGFLILVIVMMFMVILLLLD